eukprot:COSAG05_NODE_23306_length_259_cov_0.556250_1_plen_28_part_01
MGYAQSMNYVAGVGVLVCRRPDRAFSLL